MNVCEAKSRPCSTCPLRVANWDRDDTEHDEWFTAARRDSLWHGGEIYPSHQGINNGYGLICHQTMEAREKRECAGWVVLEHREVLRFVEHAEKEGGHVQRALKSYAKARPDGLTRVGLRRAANRLGYRTAALARLRVADIRPLLHPGIESPDIALPSALPPIPAESRTGATCTATTFWREHRSWSLLQHAVLPALRDLPSVRGWSAGCSNGPEAYSLAALLSSALPDAEVTIDATDRDPDMIREARAGKFTAQALRCLPQPLRDHFDTPTPGVRIASEQLRQLVRFEVGDILTAPIRNSYNLIVCCNVLCWLTPAECAAMFARAHEALAPGGYLMLGPQDGKPGEPFSHVAEAIWRKPSHVATPTR